MPRDSDADEAAKSPSVLVQRPNPFTGEPEWHVQGDEYDLIQVRIFLTWFTRNRLRKILGFVQDQDVWYTFGICFTVQMY